MFVFVILVAFSYGGLTFEYSRHNARPPGISLTFDPYVGTAVRCVAATCHQTDPPLQWTVHGFVQVHSWVRGGSIDAIVLSSGEVELLTFPGPDVRLTGNEIIGVHEIAPNRVASYPVQYRYRTRDGNPPRDVLVSVEFTDATGRQDVGREVWRVR